MYEGIQELEKMARAVNYNHWLFSQAEPFLGKRVLEIGCGIGEYVRLASKPDRHIMGIELDAGCLSMAQSRLSDIRNALLVQGNICTHGTVQEAKDFSPDSAYCFNVLEHIEDDRSALKNIARILGREAPLILIVPAFPCLYGANDKLVGHYRRYTKADLSEKLTDAGFIIERAYYLNSIGFVAWFVINRMLRQEKQSNSQIDVYDRFMIPVLRRMEGFWTPPFGQSLVMVAKCK